MIGNQTAEELRLYAKTKEEEMLQRVTAYREKREKELRKLVAARVLELELQKQFSDAIKNGEQIGDPASRLSEEVVDMIDKIKVSLSKTKECFKITEAKASINDVHQARNQLVRDLDNSLSDYRFQRESAILEKYEILRKNFETVKSAGNEKVQIDLTRHELRSDFSDKIDKLDSALVSDIESVSQALPEIHKKSICNVDKGFSHESSLTIGKIQRRVLDFLQGMKAVRDSHKLPLNDEKALASYRRRLVLTIRKRVSDLEIEFERRKAEDGRELSSEYRLEITKLLLRYCSLFRTDKVDECETPISFSGLFEKRKTPLKERIKFIVSVFEKFPTADLLAAINECVFPDMHAPYRL